MPKFGGGEIQKYLLRMNMMTPMTKKTGTLRQGPGRRAVETLDVKTGALTWYVAREKEKKKKKK